MCDANDEQTSKDKVAGDEHDEDDKCNDMNKTTLLRLC